MTPTHTLFEALGRRGGYTMSTWHMASIAHTYVPGLTDNHDHLMNAIEYARRRYPNNLFALCQEIVELSDDF